MRSEPAHRGPTMIALRARRQAFAVANEVLNPHIDSGDVGCKRCGHIFWVRATPGGELIECPNCRHVDFWPEGWRVVETEQLARRANLDPPDELPIARNAEEDPENLLGCLNCSSLSAFTSIHEWRGLRCRTCGAQMLPPSPAFAAAQARLDRKNRRVSIVVGTILALLLLAPLLLALAYMIR